MIGRSALVLGSLLVGFLLLELGVRLWRGALLDWPNLVALDRRNSVAQGVGRLIHHPELGYVARPGFARDGVSYDGRGFRSHPPLASAAAPVLVVGDSYAHGDEVADNETWAAQLQAILGRPVLNAALTGYGLDQSVLRAERIAAEVKPAAIVLGFIADDLRRAEMSRVWGRPKPYFELVRGEPLLRNVPVPPPPDPDGTLDLWQRLFGWSVALDTVLRHQGWQYEWAVDHARVLPRGAGAALACPLLKRLAKLRVPVLVVAEYDPWGWQDAAFLRDQRAATATVLNCAEAAGFAGLDLFDTMDAAMQAFGRRELYRVNHPSPLGTRLAADRIAAALKAHIPVVR
ncbi:MAG TPA: hypothetical protein VEC14_06070 [Reyranellaceae bacterium]|nr:hypothetical protein [Reyranellaceae bacterium]